MKMHVSKKSNEIVINLEVDGTLKEFDYITFINKLYRKEPIEDITFSNEIDEWEQKQINALVEKIRAKVNE
jgi:hypothetical protein